MKQLSSILVVILMYVIHSTLTFAQAPAQAPAQSPPAQVPPAQAPASSGSGPTNITAILEKAGKFSTFIRLLQSTQMDAKINTRLNNSDQLTIFAPTDDAFSELKSGSLNRFSDAQKAELIQFHTITSFFSIPQFQTTSNPVQTQAGSGQRFLLNVTASGNQVKLTTGAVNTTIADTIYADNQLAVYQVDNVLVPLDFVLPQGKVPAPENPTKATPSTIPDASTDNVGSVPTATTTTTSSSGANSVINQWMHFMFASVLCLAVISLSRT